MSCAGRRDSTQGEGYYLLLVEKGCLGCNRPHFLLTHRCCFDTLLWCYGEDTGCRMGIHGLMKYATILDQMRLYRTALVRCASRVLISVTLCRNAVCPGVQLNWNYTRQWWCGVNGDAHWIIINLLWAVYCMYCTTTIIYLYSNWLCLWQDWLRLILGSRLAFLTVSIEY